MPNRNANDDVLLLNHRGMVGHNGKLTLYKDRVLRFWKGQIMLLLDFHFLFLLLYRNRSFGLINYY